MNNNCFPPLADVVLGKRQVIKNAKKGRLKTILLATDVDENYRNEVISLAKDNKIEIISENTCEQFAQNYHLDVKCAAVGILIET